MKSARRKGWTLVWRDEFDGPALDRSKWDLDIGNGFVHGMTAKLEPAE